MHELSMIDRAMLGILISFSSFAGGYYGIRFRPSPIEEAKLP